MDKQTLLQMIDEQKDHMFDLSCQIFDNPECDGKEYFACKLLSDEMESLGFQVERAIGNQETSFRAVWTNGEGGPNIGILGEYDALLGKGHGCGHHLQTTAAIGAVVALKKLFTEKKIPVTLTVYGTPAEETYGGKIIMQEAGCFQELDVVLATHATRTKAFVGGKSLALNSYVVTFHGKAAHAAGSPWMGRSAMDAMLLAFQGLEFMREHVKDDIRMHYSIKEAIGPSNVVPAKAVAGFTLRSKNNEDLKELDERFRKLIQGACLMTETTADILPRPSYWARKANYTLSDVAMENYKLLGIPQGEPLVRDSGGSTDFGNVSCIVPGIMLYAPYIDAPGHSDQWVEGGKSEAAVSCLMNSAKMLAAVTYDLVMNPEIIIKAKEEFDRT